MRTYSGILFGGSIMRGSMQAAFLADLALRSLFSSCTFHVTAVPGHIWGSIPDKTEGKGKAGKSSELDNGERGKDQLVLGDISLACILPACLF